MIGRHIIVGNKINGRNLEEYPVSTHIDLLSDDCEHKLSSNYLVNGKYLLFDKWYHSVNQMRRLGPYVIESDDGCFLMDAVGIDKVKVNSIDDIIVHNDYYMVIRERNIFNLYDTQFNLIASQFTSVIWNDSVIWGINTLSQRNRHHYWHGECDEFLNYAHEVLISKYRVALLEKNGVWYYVDYDGLIQECFREYSLGDESIGIGV